MRKIMQQQHSVKNADINLKNKKERNRSFFYIVKSDLVSKICALKN